MPALLRTHREPHTTQVQKLLAERDTKEAELSQLLDKTPASLWEVDLDTILARWEDLLAEDERSLKSVIKAKTSKLTSKKKPAPKKKASKYDDDDEGSDGIDDDEGDEEDYQGRISLSFCFVFLFD